MSKNINKIGIKSYQEKLFKKENSDFSSIIRLNEYFGKDPTVSVETSTSNTGGQKISGGRIAEAYTVMLSNNTNNIELDGNIGYTYGVFKNRETDTNLLLGPTTIIHDSNNEKKIKTDEKIVSKFTNNNFEDDTSIIVYGSSGSGKTHIVKHEIEKGDITNIHMYNNNNQWQEVLGENKDKKEKYITNYYIRSTAKNKNSSRTHIRYTRNNNIYIYDLCGAENQITKEDYEQVIITYLKKLKTVDLEELSEDQSVDDFLNEKLFEGTRESDKEYKERDISIPQQLLNDYTYSLSNNNTKLDKLKDDKKKKIK